MDLRCDARSNIMILNLCHTSVNGIPFCLQRPQTKFIAIAFSWLAILGVCTTSLASEQDYSQMHQEMLQQINQDTYLTRSATGINKLSEPVITALTEVKRHQFVSETYSDYSYENRPLPIGMGQTISQPFIVALMTELLGLKKTDKVLEIGTGSGYQAAVLAKLAARVYTIEIIPELGRMATERLAELGYANVEVQIGDGYLGWPQEAPFDAIIVTAAAPEIPQPLIDQLKNGGVMVIPVGRQHQVQQLIKLTKDEHGFVTQKNVLAVRFVPLTGDH
jgi:protein-L-isoaspartate(D-aspartate) O-methyltransferase